MAIQIQLRRGTEAQWTAANPIIAEGELVAELDTGRFKIGNGILHWVNLPYSSGPQGIQGPAGPQGIQGVPGNQINKVIEIPDVDSTDLTNGAVLIYNSNTDKWDTQTTLSSQNLDGGEF